LVCCAKKNLATLLLGEAKYAFRLKTKDLKFSALNFLISLPFE
jgi:hypothetical protein